MFKIADDSEKTYTWPVEIFVPRSGGKKVKATMTVEFQALPQDQLNELLSGERELDDDTLTRALVGWKEGDFQGADGSSLNYSEEHKAILLNIPYVRAGIARAFFKSINGAREKN